MESGDLGREYGLLMNLKDSTELKVIHPKDNYVISSISSGSQEQRKWIIVSIMSIWVLTKQKSECWQSRKSRGKRIKSAIVKEKKKFLWGPKKKIWLICSKWWRIKTKVPLFATFSNGLPFDLVLLSGSFTKGSTSHLVKLPWSMEWHTLGVKDRVSNIVF